jgi:hypothetical protein
MFLCAWLFATAIAHADPSEAAVDVANYTLHARLDTQHHTVNGDGSLRWRNTSRGPVRDVWFHLYLNGFADEQSLFAQSSGGIHRGNTQGRFGHIEVTSLALATGENLLQGATNDPAFPADRSQLHVTLPREIAAGEEIEITMRWIAVLPEVYARTGYKNSFHMVAQWFPKIAVLEPDGRWAHFAFHGNSEFYADFGRYDVTVTVPHGYVVGATGVASEPVRHTPEGERHHFTIDSVHDFAFTAWDHFRERRDEHGPVALRVLYPPGFEHAAEITVATLRRAMPRYAERYGAYPYPGLTVVIPPEDAEGAGGMEYPTLITTGDAWWMPVAVHTLEHVTLHEFMHQYFYGLVASNENADPFLDEGFTEYATALGLEDHHGSSGSLIDVPSLGIHLGAFAFEAFESSRIEHPLVVASGAADFPTFASYGKHIYPRTATILRTAERLVGSVRFEQAMHAYATTWRFRHPKPDDFFSVMRTQLGDSVVDDFFRPALTESSYVDYGLGEVRSHRVGARYEGRAVLFRSGNIVLPMDVELTDTRGRRRVVRCDTSDRWVSVAYSGSDPLRMARIDPNGRFPIDAKVLNNVSLASGAEAPTTAVPIARVAWWLGLLLQVVGP